MDRLVEDRLVFAVTERQAFDVAKPALRRILDAGFSLQMIAGNPDLAHREGGDAADLIGALQHQRTGDEFMCGDRGREATAARTDRHHIGFKVPLLGRSEEHTSELQSLMRISYAVFCLTKTTKHR